MSDCTCDVHPPARVSALGAQFRQAIYLDAVEDATVFDPACPYHGDNGSMVACVPIPASTASEGSDE